MHPRVANDASVAPRHRPSHRGRPRATIVTMKLVDIKQLASEVKTLTAEAKATGPKTERGKTRSAINAVKHGLAGKHLLLPGEDSAEYERRIDAVFEALDPKDEAQAQLVALIADDFWKLERVGKIEQGVTLARRSSSGSPRPRKRPGRSPRPCRAW